MQEVNIYLINAEDYSIIRLRNHSKIDGIEINNINVNDLQRILKQDFIYCHNDNEDALEVNFLVNISSIAKITFK